MCNTRRRRLAWLFALVLIAGLALLCCASAHLSHHICCGENCAICACVRAGLRWGAVAAPAAWALAALRSKDQGTLFSRPAAGIRSLVAQKIRLNN